MRDATLNEIVASPENVNIEQSEPQTFPGTTTPQIKLCLIIVSVRSFYQLLLMCT